VFRWYAQLRDIEERAGTLRPEAGEPTAEDAPDVPGCGDTAALLRELDELEVKAGHMAVPLAYADELYALRAHIHMVRKKILRIPSAGHMPSPTETT
jgi:hypothetical protein